MSAPRVKAKSISARQTRRKRKGLFNVVGTASALPCFILRVRIHCPKYRLIASRGLFNRNRVCMNPNGGGNERKASQLFGPKSEAERKSFRLPCGRGRRHCLCQRARRLWTVRNSIQHPPTKRLYKSPMNRPVCL